MVNEIFKKDALAIPLFNPEELATLNGFKSFKKQIEWLSGRYVVKHMIQKLFMPDTSVEHINIHYLDQGAPYIGSAPDIPMSLSHSNAFTAAAVSFNPGQTIGMDLEKIAPMPDSYFMKTAFTQEEIRRLGNDAARVFKHWTLKEAYLKYIKKGFNESLHKVEVLGDEIRHNGNKAKVRFDSIVIENQYYLSLVFD